MSTSPKRANSYYIFKKTHRKERKRRNGGRTQGNFSPEQTTSSHASKNKTKPNKQATEKAGGGAGKEKTKKRQ